MIYYFSGTGNAKNAAEWIGNIAMTKKINTHIYNIDRFEEIIIPSLEDGRTLIGFCFPTHGFGPAPLMLKFIVLFPALLNTDVFLLNTRAGLKLSKLYIPGISGLAQIVPAAILRSKGYRIVGMQPLDLPSNWISIHPGLRKKVYQSIFERCRRIINKFANNILTGKKAYKALLSIPIDLFISPISVGYYFIGRYAIAKTFIATNDCSNCGKCIEQCPLNAIKLKSNRPFWTYKCESCMRCMNNCPQRAIETAHAYTVFIWYFGLSIIVPFILYKAIGGNIFGLDKHSTLNVILFYLLEMIFFLIIVFTGYEILHKLLRYNFFNRIIKYTSLTSFKFWRRYKAPKQY